MLIRTLLRHRRLLISSAVLLALGLVLLFIVQQRFFADDAELQSLELQTMHSQFEGRLPIDNQTLPREVPQITPHALKYGRDDNQVILLGLDGADWRYVGPMIDAGLLPNMRELLAVGAAGILSTDHAYSPTSWTTIATGRPAEVHGITPDIDVEQAWGAMDVEPQEIKVRRIWEIAREHDRTIAVYDYYFCRKRPYGPWGWIPNLPIQGGRKDLPPEIKLGDCPKHDPERDPDRLRTKACILGQKSTDLTVILCSETDAAAHCGVFAWLRRWRPDLFQDDVRVARQSNDDVLTSTWIEIDRGLGELWHNRPPGSHMVICSDHGFGIPKLDDLHATFSDSFLHFLGLKREQLEQGDRVKAQTPFGTLRVKLHHRIDQMPVVHLAGAEHPESILLHLEQLELTPTGATPQGWRIKLRAALSLDLGPHSVKSIDLKPEESGRLLIIPRKEALLGTLIHGRDEGTSAVDVIFQTGEHHPDDQGIVLIAGPRVRPGARIVDADLLDITPTLLYLLGLPVGRDMEGRVLSEAFEPRRMQAKPVSFIQTHETSPVQRDPLRIKTFEISVDEMDPQTVERLRSIGYLQ
ncbi:MAG: alkaline phosphatase family protein [Candidatus Alcyoniella australis]|nr:alkaline phosphatase family protein [Candidatus Alcyoniella australis]